MIVRRVAVPFFLFLAAACGRGEKASLPTTDAVAARAVRTVKPSSHVETGLARATGVIRSREDAILSAKATGQIKSIRVNVGDRVKAGTVLAQMDSTNARIALENAKAMLHLAEARLAEADRTLTRGKVLLEGEGMSQSAYEQVQTGREMAAAQLDQARAAMSAAQQAVADATIVAPFAGTITAKFRNAGDTVTLMPVSPIVALTDINHLEIRLVVPEALEPSIKAGQLVRGTTTPGGREFQAKVRMKGAVVDPVTRSVEVLADVLPAEGLKPGTLITADFGKFGEGSKAGEAGGLFVPSTAVKTEGKASWVFVVAAGKAERRDVTAEPVLPGTVLVRQGLAPDADVVLEPGTLAAGDAVVPLPN